MLPVPFVHDVINQREGFLFLGPCGFFHGACQGLELGADFGFGDQVEARRKDRRFQHGVLGSVEAEEVSSVAGVDDGRFQAGAIR